MSLTIITSSGNTVSAEFDRRFGRAAWFCAYNEETGETKFYRNEFVNATQGAGTRVAERMMELKAKKIISGDFGPKAKDLLDRFRIQLVVIQDTQISVQDIIERIKNKNNN
jgi:predicted Fe-Mo cluster-binding NifX family protein